MPISSGRGHPGAVRLHPRGASFHVGRLRSGEAVELPAAAHVFAFVALGDGHLEGAGPMGEGDAAALIGAGTPGFRAGAAWDELLVWETD